MSLNPMPGGSRRMERWWQRIAWLLPAPLAYWCAVRVVAHGTTGVYGSTVVPELKAMGALKRWEDSRGGDRRVGSPPSNPPITPHSGLSRDISSDRLG